MSRYWSGTALGVEPYTPGEQPQDRKYIKLNTNENPYPPSPKVIEAIKRAAGETLKLYPDPSCNEFRETVAQYYGLKKDQVFAGNGSDELLAFAFMAFFNPGRPIVFPDITYSFFPVFSALFHIDYKLIPLDEDFSVPAEKFFNGNGGIVIANPNAPTGKSMPVKSIREILEHNADNVVIIDEAYIDFGGESAIGLIRKYPNLLVIRTLSKSRSLAGLRVGFAAGQEDLIEGVGRIKNSFNSYTLDRIALAGATEAIRDESYFRETRQKIIRTRERISKALEKMGFKVVESCANFIFISHPAVPAGLLFNQLKEAGILVRYFDKLRINNFLRVSIGSDEEMDRFLESVEKFAAFLV